MRRVRRLFADAPLGQPHPLQDGLGEEEGKAPIELRPEVPAQHLLGRPGNSGLSGSGMESLPGMCPYENKTRMRRKRLSVEQLELTKCAEAAEAIGNLPIGLVYRASNIPRARHLLSK